MAEPDITAAPEDNRVALVAGVVGVVSLVLSFIPFFGFIAEPGGIVAIVLGIFGLQRAGRLGGDRQAIAITALVCGAIAVVIPIAWILFFAVHTA